jgi:hypothetical protein
MWQCIRPPAGLPRRVGQVNAAPTPAGRQSPGKPVRPAVRSLWPGLVAAGLALLGPGTARAQQEAPRVRYLATQFLGRQDGRLVVRGAFEVTGPPRRAYDVFFQLRLDEKTPLRFKAFPYGTPWKWGRVHSPPAARTARWDDCRVGIGLEYLRDATNLPRGQKTLLYAVCDVKDVAANKYLGSGWSTRAAVFVTTDAGGNVVRAEAPPVPPAPEPGMPALPGCRVVPGAGPRPAAAGKYVTWVDPTEKAFTVHAPRGWRVEGGIARPSPVLAKARVRVTSPGGEITLFAGNPDPLFVEPHPTLDGLGWHEGSTHPYQGLSYTVARYPPGARFETGSLLPRRAPGARPFDKKARPDLAREVRAAGVRHRLDAGEVAYTFRRDGKARVGWALCLTESYAIAGGLTGWQPRLLAFYECPEGREAEAKAALARLLITAHLQEDWVRREAEGQAGRGRILLDAHAAVTRVIHDSYWGRLAEREALTRLRSENLTGRVDLYDPRLNVTHYLEPGLRHYRYHWRNGAGKLAGTNTPEPPDGWSGWYRVYRVTH